MGTLPLAQREGLGTAVLQPRLTILDQAHHTAVLETSEPGNLRFYGRLGFEIVAELAQLPHSAPTTWIMRRSANTSVPFHQHESSARSATWGHWR